MLYWVCNVSLQIHDKHKRKKEEILLQNHKTCLAQKPVRDIPFEVSVVNFTFFWSITSLNAGQPQPESNLVSDVNSVSLHTTHVYRPASVVLLYFPVKALQHTWRGWAKAFRTCLDRAVDVKQNPSTLVNHYLA